METLLCLRWRILLICSCKQEVVLVEIHEFFLKLRWADSQRVMVAFHNQILWDGDDQFWRATCWVSFQRSIQSRDNENNISSCFLHFLFPFLLLFFLKNVCLLLFKLFIQIYIVYIYIYIYIYKSMNGFKYLNIYLSVSVVLCFSCKIKFYFGA